MRVKKWLITALFAIGFTALGGAIVSTNSFVRADDTIIREPTEDTTPPFLLFSDDLDIDDTPVGQVNEFYPFWEVSGYDAKGEYLENITDNIVCSVYYGEEQLDGIEFLLGGFIPTKTGEYTLVYTLTDEAGNEAEKLVGSFEVKAFLRPIEISLHDKFLETYYVGQTLTVPAYTAQGGSGDLVVEISVNSYGNAISEKLKETSYFLEKTGKYFVVYTVSDYLGNEQQFFYYFNVEYSEGPIIENTVYPVAIASGRRFYYNLPKAYDYSYSGTATEVPVCVEIAENDPNGEYITPCNEYYQPSDTATSIFVRYVSSAVLSSNNKTVTNPVEIPVIKPQTIADYFYTLSGSIDKRFSTTSAKELYFSPIDGSSMQFINAVDVNSFKINLLFDTNIINYGKVSFVLNDSVNPLQSLTVTVERSTDADLNITVGGGTYVVSGLTEGKCTISLSLLDTVLTVNGSKIEISNFDTGTRFTGFSSGKAYTTIYFDDVAEVETLRITDFINMSSLYDTILIDDWRPTLRLTGEIPAICDVYSYVELPSALVFDTIDTDCRSATLTFSDPDGNVILSSVEASEINRVRLEKTGQYTGYYVAVDASGNRARIPISVYARDLIAPKIEIDGQINATAKLGETLKIPDYYAYDNITENLTPYVFLITPTFGIKTVSKNGVDREYTFVKTGVYTLQFFVFDSDYNERVLEFTITVTE